MTVYFYTHTLIAPFGSGTQIRQFTNIRAYLDLGMQVKVIHITQKPAYKSATLPDGAEYYPIKPDAAMVGWRHRIAYKIGFPFEDVLHVLYPDRQFIIHAVLENEKKTPGAIHHFEYPSTANVAISLQGEKLKLIWSCHDWESDRYLKLSRMREEAGRRKPFFERKRRLLYAKKIEKRIAKAISLVMTISEHEKRIFREKLGIDKAELLPISWPDECPPCRSRVWAKDGMIRLLHVGSPDAMVGYYSLNFILEDVYPLLPQDILSRLELWIVGKIKDTPYSGRIRQLAQKYPQVKFLGFVDNIRDIYTQCDLHLVGNSVATGLRTRIIESFVCGIPVLSVSNAAEGIVGLQPGQNILIEDTPENFAAQITSSVIDPSSLQRLSERGRALYDHFYSRPLSSAILGSLLAKYIFVASNSSIPPNTKDVIP
ncbi:MAG: glycosyltransferase family 4 protein [Desulfobacterales bacterium]|nr:glycosyltransferase family 4 protein [Desulfobacterales bacterium]